MLKLIFPNINSVLEHKSDLKLAFFDTQSQNNDLLEINIVPSKEDTEICFDQKLLLETYIKESELCDLLINFFKNKRISDLDQSLLLEANIQILQVLAKAMYLHLPIQYENIIKDLINDFYNKCNISGAILYVSSKDYSECKKIIKKLDLKQTELSKNIKLEKEDVLQRGQFKLESENIALEQDVSKMYERVVAAFLNAKSLKK